MFILSSHPRWEESFNKKETGTETKSRCWILRGNLHADQSDEVGFAEPLISFQTILLSRAVRASTHLCSLQEAHWLNKRQVSSRKTRVARVSVSSTCEASSITPAPREPCSSSPSCRLLPPQAAAAKCYSTEKAFDITLWRRLVLMSGGGCHGFNLDSIFLEHCNGSEGNGHQLKRNRKQASVWGCNPAFSQCQELQKAAWDISLQKQSLGLLYSTQLSASPVCIPGTAPSDTPLQLP